VSGPVRLTLFELDDALCQPPMRRTGEGVFYWPRLMRAVEVENDMAVADNSRLLTAAVALTLAGAPLHAATLVSVEAFVVGLEGASRASATFQTGAENNDSKGNAAMGQRDLRNTLDIDAVVGNLTGPVNYIDLVFTVESVFDAVTGITEFAVTQSLRNAGGTGLGSADFELGFGTGAMFDDNPSTIDDGLSFDMEVQGIDTPLPSSNVFTYCAPCSNSDRIVLDDGALASDSIDTIEFQLDIPDLFFDEEDFNIPNAFLLAPDEETGFAGGYTFTLRQTPAVVPVPATAWLFGSALLVLGGRVSRRRG
jgi:hypothetical protein